jgi:radical SAM protein with 4Fe4S-binding SPASM domain
MLLLQDGRARESLWNNCLKEIGYTHGLLRALGYPQVFEIETTNRCPCTCIMCPRTYAMTRAVGDMDIGLFRDVVDQMRPAWQMDKITGRPLIRLLHYGEPFVYKHFAESIEHCHDRGFCTHLSSNPSVWTDQRIEEVLDTQVDEILIMVDGMDDATSMAIRGKAASFVRAERNIRRMAEEKVRRGQTKPYMVIAMIKQPGNRHQWELFQRYWEDIEGVDATYLAHFSGFDGTVTEINTVGAALAMRDDLQAAQVQRQVRLSALPCYYPWHSVSVTWQGEVVPCCRDYDNRLVLGDLKRQTLLQVWNGSAMQRFRRQMASGFRANGLCGRCGEASLEIGLPGQHYVVARCLRRLGLGKMHRMACGPQRPSSDTLGQPALSGPQNISNGGYRRKPSKPHRMKQKLASLGQTLVVASGCRESDHAEPRLSGESFIPPAD